MTDDELFLKTYSDLARRLEEGNEYAAMQAGGLIRRLLLDREPARYRDLMGDLGLAGILLGCDQAVEPCGSQRLAVAHVGPVDWRGR